MAFPTVAARNEASTTTAATTLTIPFTQTTGHLVIVYVAGSSGETPTSIGDGFTAFSHLSDPQRSHWYYKVLDGSEGGNVVYTGASDKRAALSWNITGAISPATQPPEAGGTATATSATPDPASLSPTGGAKDYLWLAMFNQSGEEADDDTWCNNAPTNYTNLIQKTSGTGGAPTSNISVAGAEWTNNAASENPGTFGTDQSLLWQAFVVAVHPAPASQTVTADVAVSVTPSLPDGSLTHRLTGAVVTVVPSLPDGRLDPQRIFADATTATPSIPNGSLTHQHHGRGTHHHAQPARWVTFG